MPLISLSVIDVYGLMLFACPPDYVILAQLDCPKMTFFRLGKAVTISLQTLTTHFYCNHSNVIL
jgi:hypothetical protein